MSKRVAGIASAKLQASFNSRINIDGCLVFFFNPCCKTFGLKFVLDDPVILNAFGKLKVDIEAFNLGISLGSEDITVDPLRNIELKGFSPEIGSWNLPPILDKTIQLDDESLCAKLGVPGSNVGLDFCVVLGNFSAGINGVNVCPRLTISLGGRVLLDLSYTALSSDLPECLTLSFLPTCSYKGSSVSPDIVQLFKSSDANNDQKIMVSELQKSKLLLGVFESEEANSASFSEMDTNSDGEVNFAEFEKYTATQQEINASGDYVTKKEGKKFSGGDIAMAVIFSILGTALIVCAVLAGVAQYKGIINNKYLGKVIPTK